MGSYRNRIQIPNPSLWNQSYGSDSQICGSDTTSIPIPNLNFASKHVIDFDSKFSISIVVPLVEI